MRPAPGAPCAGVPRGRRNAAGGRPMPWTGTEDPPASAAGWRRRAGRARAADRGGAVGGPWAGAGLPGAIRAPRSRDRGRRASRKGPRPARRPGHGQRLLLARARGRAIRRRAVRGGGRPPSRSRDSRSERAPRRMRAICAGAARTSSRSPQPHPRPARALAGEDRQGALCLLHRERPVDLSPREVHAILFDEAWCRCSPSTISRFIGRSGEGGSGAATAAMPLARGPSALPRTSTACGAGTSPS
jgi:hypothetical protein